MHAFLKIYSHAAFWYPMLSVAPILQVDPSDILLLLTAGHYKLQLH